MATGLPDWMSSVGVEVASAASSAWWDGLTGSYEDELFETGESPQTLDVNGDLGKNAHDGYIMNDGPGKLKAQFSNDGISFGGTHTIKSGEPLLLEKLDIDKIKLIWVADTAYRILVV